MSNYIAYVINLDYAKDRRKYMQEQLEKADISFEFVDGVIGKNLKLPHPDYDKRKYRLAHGKRTSMGELGCYFSHIKVLKLFLKTDKDHALIMEDDIEFADNFKQILEEALAYDNHFDFLKLCDIHRGKKLPVLTLPSKYQLSVNFVRQTGAGGYLVNRKAAEMMIEKLLPMWLPYDHAFDREWGFDVVTLSINPNIIFQSQLFETQIDVKSKKYPFLRRYSTVFPYRLYNETFRLLFRSKAYLHQYFLKQNKQ